MFAQMTLFEHVHEDTYLCDQYMFWYSGSVTWKAWLYCDDALKYIITVLQVYELQF